jgi:uncharacterized membrane protein YfcA
MDASMSAANLILLGGGAFLASMLAAVAGFGGSAVLLPALVLVFGVRDAIPILTVAQLIGNLSRVWFNRRDLDLPVVGWFALGGVPAALIGTEALATVVMHVTKLVVYGSTAILTSHSITVGLALGSIMILGSFVGKKILDRLPERISIFLIEATLLIAGLGFLIRG